MKNKILILILLLTVLTFSCENFDLDLQENPNEAGVSQGDINSLYNQVQLDFQAIHFILEDQTGEVSRMYNATAPNYGAATLPSVFDGLWTLVYADFLQDVKSIEELGIEAGLNIHIGSAKILQAFVLMEMVDVFADIPFSEIGQGVAELSPKLDDGEDVYAAAEALLDDAITLLQNPGQIAPDFDNFYDGNPASWITLANTVKLRSAFLQGKTAEFNAIVEAGDIIDAEEEDFQFNYGSNRLNPDSRHPRYINQYEQADGDYMSNYYMWMLRAEKLDVDMTTELRDPRLRYYFYRKVSNSDKQPTDSYGCVLSGLPDQSFRPDEWTSVDARLPYCYAAADGYIGRDHLNGSGIPADGAIRTAYGLYPMAGDFDNNEFKNTQNGGTTGGLGQGILPIILSSFVDFMRAEVALSSGSEDPKALLLSGIEKSLTKVRGFESLVSDKLASTITVNGIETTVQDAFAITDQDITDYGSLVGRLYDEAASNEERLDVIIKEFFIAAFGNGLISYNNYRRTGLPSNMEPALQPATGGDFPRSFRYPNAFVDRNTDVEQKSETELVFWDLGTSNVY